MALQNWLYSDVTVAMFKIVCNQSVASNSVTPVMEINKDEENIVVLQL